MPTKKPLLRGKGHGAKMEEFQVTAEYDFEPGHARDAFITRIDEMSLCA